MKIPLLGITTYGPDGKPPSYTLPTAYVEAVVQAGGQAVLLPDSGLAIDEVLGMIDGLILSGGGDLDPSLYQGGSHDAIYNVSPSRDRFELALAAAALALPDLPILGICRGMQVLNLSLGGDLHLHLPDVRGEEVVHRLPPREPTTHSVRLDGGTLLEGIYGVAEFQVCSWHHQGVRRLGDGLRAIAHADDGVIEAVVHEQRPFALGVQWHPEMQVAEDPLQRRLFGALIDHAGRQR